MILTDKQIRKLCEDSGKTMIFYYKKTECGLAIEKEGGYYGWIYN